MPAIAEKPRHVNVPLTDEVIESFKGFRKAYDWTQKDAIEFGVQALKLLMEMHEQVAQKVEPEVAELYRRVARELPSQLIEPRPKPNVGIGWTDKTKDKPAIQVDGWFITAENGDLVAENEKGVRGRVERGAVRAMPKRSPKKAVLVKPSLN